MTPIDPSRTSFNWPNARACAERAAMAYVKSGQALPVGAHLICNEATDAQAVILNEGSCISVAFCGSRAPEDFIHDAEFWLAESRWALKGVPAKVHHGFLFDFESLATDVLATVARLLLPHPATPIFVIGHSLGGGEALPCALEFAEQGWNVAGVYTFGQPRVGDSVFATIYDRHPLSFAPPGATLKDITFRIVNENDIVPRVPFPLAGYRHCGQKVFLEYPTGWAMNPPAWTTAISDARGFYHAALKHTDVLIGNHLIHDYQTRIAASCRLPF